MAAPAVYLDECIDEPLNDALCGRDYSLVTAREAGALGLSDKNQIEYATALGMPILSYNRRHFQRSHARLIREGREYPGIIVLPQDAPLRRRLLRAVLLLEWVGEQEMDSLLSRIGVSTIPGATQYFATSILSPLARQKLWGRTWLLVAARRSIHPRGE